MSDCSVSLRDVQADLLEALRTFDDLCRQHGLTYWLDGGTLLGAVRHKGFIPWDDDVDVCLPREQFTALRDAARDLPDSVEFRSGREAGFAVNAKVIVIGLSGVPHGLPDEAQNACLPVGIDILAVDPTLRGVRTRQYVSRLGRALASRYAAGQRSQAADTALSRAAWRLMDRTPPGQVHFLQDCLVKAHSFADPELLQYGIDTAMPDTVFPLRTVLPTRPLTFQGLDLLGPADPHEYLRIYYGADYMTPPSVQRSPHASAFWYTG
jgi:lipopolysaccharide cholinephosphotransferase